MNLIIIVSVVLFICTYLVQGFNLATVLSFIATLLFCGRKVGYFAKIKTAATLEGLGLFITVTMQLVLHRFNLVEFLIVVALRAVFLCVFIYEETQYVYPSKEKRREELK